MSKLNKRVKSRNQMILDLTSPLTENSSYKNPSQKEAWGSSIFLGESIILPDYSQESSWRPFFLRGKWRTNIDLLYELGKPYLRSSKLLACWNHLGGI